uniref:Putative D27 family protein n=1 Tax=Chaetosphaeridium globosum TaxID=96477 RepID=I6PEW1_CHAGL|nr:putative D27 family protein [Chaetosphaeridium globosum]
MEATLRLSASPCSVGCSGQPTSSLRTRQPLRTTPLPRNAQSAGSRRRGTVRCAIAEPSGKPAPMGQITKYNDNWFDLLFMSLFAKKMEIETGKKTRLTGYEGFVDISKRVMQGRSPAEQQASVRRVLLSMLPPEAPASFRKLFPPTKLSAEINAWITVPFFAWLVGPAKLYEVEVNGVKQWSGVKIEKCRYLENSGCVGMCVNMCKVPTQDFFTNEFGLPLTMTPNFEDMSCEMVYGQLAPPVEEDPAYKQPCFAALCSIAQGDLPSCPKLSA